MRSLKLKTKCVTAGTNLPTVTLQHPQAPLGVNAVNDHSMVITDEITEIPDDVAAASIVAAWRDTCNMTFLGRDESDPAVRHSFRFSEIGAGRIIR
jgi:hypothetical protein